jgi:two-component system, chemotaxis family, protein-glutamate methylesterase/glutaminase
MIRVLIVDDSAVAREHLSGLLSADPEIEVAGTAGNGAEALPSVLRLNPDAITMDINMPVMDGLEATRRIMEIKPTPIIIVSAHIDPQEVKSTFQAIEAGALAVVSRPYGFGHPHEESSSKELVQTIKLMSEIKVIKRWPSSLKASSPAQPFLPKAAAPVPNFKIVAIGASTGGPAVIHSILNRLPKNLPAPILIVQHIAAGFLPGMMDWLTRTTGFPVSIPKRKETILPGHVYLAPDNCHLVVTSTNRIDYLYGPAEAGARPSISSLFRSIAKVYGPQAIGVLLTGMGSDGAAGLKRMKDSGAITIIQDQESCVIPSMPSEALALEPSHLVLSPPEIAHTISALWQKTEFSQPK